MKGEIGRKAISAMEVEARTFAEIEHRCLTLQCATVVRDDNVGSQRKWKLGMEEADAENKEQDIPSDQGGIIVGITSREHGEAGRTMLRALEG